MPLKVNLVVATLLMLAVCVSRAVEELPICSRSYTEEDAKFGSSLRVDGREFEDSFVGGKNATLARSGDTMNVTEVEDLEDEMMQDKILDEIRRLVEGEKLQASARGRRKMDRMLMAMLVAYKMKFLALVPTLIGSIVLLLASNALAGFFFALFAAVVSMKGR